MTEVRKHQGIRQSGPNVGMLKKGYCYDKSKVADKKVKKGGKRPIKKSKKK